MHRGVVVAALSLALLPGARISRGADCCNIDVVRQSDGGVIGIAEVAYFAVARRVDGILDPDFGDGGVTEPVDGLPISVPLAFAVGADDKIVAAGTLQPSPFSDPAVVVVRYNADGSLDTEFGEGGFAVSATFDGPEDIRDIAVRPGGGVVVTTTGEVGPDEPNYAVVVFAADGAPDTTFGDPVVASGLARDLDVQADDNILVVLGGPPFFDSGRIVRFDLDGSLDAGFGSNGSVVPDLGPEDDRFYALVIQPDGKLVVAGEAGVGTLSPPDRLTDLALLRLLPNGDFDEDFGEGGKRITSLGGRFEGLRQLVLQCDGSFLAAGFSESPSDDDPGRGPILIRYTSSGDVDGSFGVDGVSTCDVLRSACTDPNRCVAPTTTSTSTSSTVPSTTSTIGVSTTSTSVSTTSTTSPPAEQCATSCDDGDACTSDACQGRECVHGPLAGAAVVTCVCERDVLAACRQEGLPPDLLGHSDRACEVLEKLPDAGKKKARRILAKALRQWGKIARLLDRPKTASEVSEECRSALEGFLADAAARAVRVRGEVGGR